MYQFPIGVMLESFRLPAKEAIAKAAELGAKGIQMYATAGEHAPENMTTAMRKELRDCVESYGLCFSALCGDLGGGFGDPEKNPERIEKSKRIMDMAKELGTDIVTTHIGVVPEDPNHPRYIAMQETCSALATYANSIGSHFAIETGPEKSDLLRKFLDSLGGGKGVAVNLDPANLVMVAGDDPVKAVQNLAPYIVHTHAKDGVMLRQGNPEFIYGIVHPVPQEYQGVAYFAEVPLGQGGVHFDTYLAALDEVGYRGFLTIEREVGETPEADIRLAADHLRSVMAKG